MLFTGSGRIVIKNARHRTEEMPVDPDCGCYTCRHYSRAYLHHLFSAKEILSYRLNTIHNLCFYLSLMAAMRKALADGNFADFRRDFHAGRGSGNGDHHDEGIE
jgi:queuine tRNA-ribosyltransferase